MWNPTSANGGQMWGTPAGWLMTQRLFAGCFFFSGQFLQLPAPVERVNEDAGFAPVLADEDMQLEIDAGAQEFFDRLARSRADFF